MMTVDRPSVATPEEDGALLGILGAAAARAAFARQCALAVASVNSWAEAQERLRVALPQMGDALTQVAKAIDMSAR